jgi:hypothetical protein
VTFNGHTHDEFVPQKTAMYVSQNDLHNGELTVRETLDFSARMHGVGTQYRESHLPLQRASLSIVCSNLNCNGPKTEFSSYNSIAIPRNFL